MLRRRVRHCGGLRTFALRGRIEGHQKSR
jgi:hypothetical protein